MLPITNEPNGQNENQKRNESGLTTDENENSRPVDQTQNNLAGNAAGNLPPEEAEDSEDESATDKGEGFVGDFAKPQHDE